MLFNSLVFIVFFLVVYGLYLGFHRQTRLQNAILLVASYLFYGVLGLAISHTDPDQHGRRTS